MAAVRPSQTYSGALVNTQALTRTFTFQANFSSDTLSGVGYALVDVPAGAVGTVFIARTTAGVVNLGGGSYGARVTLPDTFGVGFLRWDNGQVPPEFKSQPVNAQALAVEAQATNPATQNYNPALQSIVSLIRFDLGDTDADNFLLDDQTIAAKLTQYSLTVSGQPVLVLIAQKRATLSLARGLVSRYAQAIDMIKDADGSQVSYVQRLIGWHEIIDRLVLEGVDVPRGLSVIRGVRPSYSRLTEWG